MIIEKPKWVNHGGHAIFSIDIHPDGTRFATAGGDNVVRIWNLEAIKVPEESLPPNTAKRLASLCDHFGPVNCVRWSHDGRYLASGSDDKLVMLHEKRPGGGVVEFGCAEQTNLENWKVVSTLRGHSSDVVDLTWSPSDTQIASCSLDNSIKIFDVKLGSVVATLSAHTSLVKGVSWDPIGSFLASQSDDKSVIVWKTSDWSKVTQVKGPYSKSVGATFFRRLDWSPCGSFLTTPHAFQTPQHTAAVIERSDWSKVYDFVGHVAPVVTIRYCDAMFRKTKRKAPNGTLKSLGLDMDEKASKSRLGEEKQNEKQSEGPFDVNSPDASLPEKASTNQEVPEHDLMTNKANDAENPTDTDENKRNHIHHTVNGSSMTSTGVEKEESEQPSSLPYHCLALGSQDYQLTVWMTSRFQPIVVVKNLFIQPVVDLSWSSDGRILLCCSSDGSIAGLLFDEKEIGCPLSKQEIIGIKKEKYGEFQARDIILAESPALLNLQLDSTMFEKKNGHQLRNLETKDPKEASITKLIPQQKSESEKTSSISKPDLVNQNTPPLNLVETASGEVNPSNQAEDESLMQGKKSDDVKIISEDQNVKDIQFSPLKPPSPPLTSLDVRRESQKDMNTKNKQVEVRRADGRRRIIPVSINPPATKISTPTESLVSPPEASVVVNRANGKTATDGEKDNLRVGSKRLHSTLDTHESTMHSKDLNNGEVKKSKLWNEAEGRISMDELKKGVRTGNSAYLDQEHGRKEWSELEAKGNKEKIFVVEAKDNVWKEGKSLVEVHDKKKVLFVEVKKTEFDEIERSWTLQTANLNNPKESANRVVCFRDNKLLWEDHLESEVCCLTGNTNFFAVASKNGQLQVYTPCGRRALPPIICSSPVCIMTCDKDFHLLVLTYGGDLLMWHLGDGENVLDESISPLISFMGKNQNASLRVHSIHITKKSEPVIFLDDGNSFVFHLSYNSWIRLTESGFPCSTFSSSWPNKPLITDGSNFVALQQLLQRTAETNENYFSKNKRFLLKRGDSTESSHSRAYLEEKLCACEIFCMPDEYKKYLVLYARHLAREGNEFKLRELCEEFLGPIHIKSVIDEGEQNMVQDTKWEPNADDSKVETRDEKTIEGGNNIHQEKDFKRILSHDKRDQRTKERGEWSPFMAMGLNKRELLRKEILPCLVSNRSLHRLLNEYLDLLNCTA